MFKEVASSNWQADLISDGKTSKRFIYKAGPGWKLVFLPEVMASGQVVFEYQRNWFEKLSVVISIITAISVLGYGLMRLFKGDWDEKLMAKIRGSFSQKQEAIKGKWDDEE